MHLAARRIVISALLACLTALSPALYAQSPEFDNLHPRSLNHAGIYALRQIDPTLTGDGVKIAVVSRSVTYIDGEPQNDYRPAVQHSCFDAASLAFHDLGNLPAGVSPHATAVCSILFGRDPEASNADLGPLYYQGVVPDASADVYEFWHFTTNNVFPQSAPDADVVTASMGTEFPDWWTRGIESLVQRQGLIVVAGIGNGSDAYDPPLYPAAAANVIGVGVVNSVDANDLAIRLANFALAYPEHSTAGPTDDGRCKPDIVAPGDCLAADVNDPNLYEPTGNWSSFSTPVVAGAIGLLTQEAKRNPALTDAVSAPGANCIIKALLLNSAAKLPYWHKGRLGTDDDHTAPLDYIQGAGLVNALAAYENLIAGPAKPGLAPSTAWDNNTLRRIENPQNIYSITLPDPANRVITATAAWNRYYRSLYPFKSVPEKDCDLRLELWAVDPNNPDNDYLLDYSDSPVDNVEHIYCLADPNFTDYQIVLSVNDHETQAGDLQQYGLAWSVADAKTPRDTTWFDLNADGIVDKTDLAVFVENWLKARESSDDYILGDINADGTIDTADAEIIFDRAGLKADWRPDNAADAE